MNMTLTDEVVLKQDVLGRVKMPRERRERLLDEFERSGLSGQKFAEHVGVKYQTFATWVQRRRRQAGAHSKFQRSKPLRLLEAMVESGPGGMVEPLVLQLPGGVRLEVAGEKQAALAAILVRALSKPC